MNFLKDRPRSLNTIHEGKKENDLYFCWKLVFLLVVFLEFGMVNLVTEGKSLGGKKLIF